MSGLAAEVILSGLAAKPMLNGLASKVTLSGLAAKIGLSGWAAKIACMNVDNIYVYILHNATRVGRNPMLRADSLHAYVFTR